jgi:hypothetical protein
LGISRYFHFFTRGGSTENATNVPQAYIYFNLTPNNLLWRVR